MSTELYLDNSFAEDKNSVKSEHFSGHGEIDAESKWLIKEIIKPELPNIIDNVNMCLELLTNDQVYVMPLSNGSKEADNNVPSIKGIVSRQREYIVDFQVLLKFPDFQNGKTIALKMKPESKFLLKQFDIILHDLNKIVTSLNELEAIQDVHKFINTFTDIVDTLNGSIQLLESPPNYLTYPKNSNQPMKEIFNNYKTDCETNNSLIGLEVLLIRNELCIDFRNLTKVTRKPWSEIDARSGKSFIDRIKDELTADRSKNIRDFLEENGVTVEESNFLNSFINSTFKSDSTTTMREAQDYLRRGTTFDSIAVLETSKIAVSTSDPILVCISSKLNGLKYSIENHYSNLKIHH